MIHNIGTMRLLLLSQFAQCGRDFTFSEDKMVPPHVQNRIAKLKQDFRSAFNVDPRWVLLGGRFYSDLMREVGGRPIVIQEMRVQFVKHDECAVGFNAFEEGI